MACDKEIAKQKGVFMSKGWVFTPQSGGRKASPLAQDRIRHRIEVYVETNYAGKYNRIDVHFRGQFCYVDVYVDPYVPDDFNEELLQPHHVLAGRIPFELCIRCALCSARELFLRSSRFVLLFLSEYRLR